MSRELNELESGIEQLKRDARNKRTLIAALESEKADLLKRSEELSGRLRKMSDAYKESFSKLADSVNSQVTQLKMDIAEISNNMKGLSGLEQRLEAQERAHEKVLSKHEKDLALIEKSLSDVKEMKSELSRQRGAFQDAKSQMEKSLQAGMSYLRKEMEVNRREDARAALEEFKQEIERIASLEKELSSQKRSQESRIDGIMEELSSVRSTIAELRSLRERSESMQELGADLDKRVNELASRQKAASAMITAELSKKLDRGMASLRKDLDTRRSEDAKAQIREFKQELQRIASMEEGLKQNENRLSRVAEGLSELKPVTDQVSLLRDKIEEALHMNQSLADRTVSTSDFERAAKSMSRRTEDLENRLFVLDKRLSTSKDRLEKAIIEVLNDEKILEGTQDNIKKWFDAKYQDLEKRLSAGLDALTTQIEEGAALVDHLRTRSQKLDLMTKEVPKRLDDHSKQLTRLSDARGSLASSIESLSGDMKTLSARLSSSLERISGLEKGLSGVDKEKGTRLDRLSSDVAAYQQEIKNLGLLLSEFSDSAKSDVASLRAELSSSIKLTRKELDGRLEKLSETSLGELKERTRGLASVKELESELKVLKADLSRISSLNSSVTERLSKELGGVRKSIDSRLSELSEGQAVQFKKEFDYIAKNIDSIRDISSDIKIFSSRLSDIERFSRTLLSQQDFVQFRKHIESRLSEITGSSLKSMKALSEDLESFKARVESGALTKSDFSKSMELMSTRLEDTGTMAKESYDELRRDLESFKAVVSDRLNELKGSQLVEFKSELKRISQIEGELDSYSKTHEKRLDELCQSVSSLQSMPSEIGVLRERLESLEDLSGSLVHGREFSQKVNGMQSVIEQLRSNLSGIDKKLHAQAAAIDAAVQEALSEDKLMKKGQDAMSKLIDSRISGIDKRLSSSIKELSAGLEKGISEIDKTKEARLDELSGKIDSMKGMLDSSKDDIMNFREQIIGHVNDITNAYEKRFGELSKDLSRRQAGNIEKGLSELNNLKARLSETDRLARTLSEKAVPAPEFVETVKSISGRIENMEKLYSEIDKKTSVHESQLDSAVQKALSDDRLLKAGQKHARELVESRLNDIEGKLLGDVASHGTRLSAVTEDISSIKEELARLKTFGEHLDEDTMSRISESAASFSKARSGIEERMESMMTELKSMNDRLITESGRVSVVEKGLKTSMEAQKAGLREMLSKQKSDVSKEMNEEISSIVKDAEIGELKRRREFENLLMKFQELHVKTQQNLDAITSQRESFNSMEKGLKERMNKNMASVQTKLAAEHKRLTDRLSDAENLVMKLNNMVSELDIRIGKKKDAEVDIGDAVGSLKAEIIDRIRTNEEMFDSEMDAFKNKIDGIAYEMGIWKDVQQKRSYDFPETERKQLELLNKSISSIDQGLKSNKAEMKKFKEYIIEYMNNLVNTYENRVGNLKKDVDYKLNSIKPSGQ